MKKTFLHSFVLAASFLLSGIVAHATTVAEALAIPMDQWSFDSKIVTIDGMRFYLDKTNGLAEFLNFENKNQAPQDFVMPDIVKYEDTDYVIVSIAYYYWIQQETVTQLRLPEGLRRLRENALYGDLYPNLRKVVLPEHLELIEQNAFSGWTNRTLQFTGTTVPTVNGPLCGGGNYRLKIYVPAASFKAYHNTDYIEDHCVVSDDLSVSTVKTGKVDNGELGYAVVADILPEIRTYSDVNKLIVEEGTIDATDFYQIRQMKNLIELDLSGLSIAEIPYEALSNCWQLEKVILPETVETIAGYAFNQTGIRELDLKKTKYFTGSRTFYNCDSLRSIVIPEGVEEMGGSEMFRYSENLNHISLPSTLRLMGERFAEECDLLDITVPGSLKVIPYAAFDTNRRLAEINIQEGVEMIRDYAFYNAQALTQLALPSSIRRIYSMAFSNCTSLSDLTLNEGLEELDYRCFSSCRALTEVTLPSSLIFALDQPFDDCTSLAKIKTFALIPPTVRSQVPTRVAGNIELDVPQWSFQEYMTTPGWLEYQDHLVIDPTILPQNIVINKDFEFVLTEEQNAPGYKPNIRLLYNTERIDDGFGHQKYERGNLTVSNRSKLNVNNFSMYVSPYAKFYSDLSRFYSNRGYDYDHEGNSYSPNALIAKGEMRAEDQTYHLMLCNDRWQFISFPFDVKMSDIVPDDELTQWIVRSYSGQDRADQQFDNTWHNLAATDILEAGKGYIMMCYNSGSQYSYNYWSYQGPVTFTLKPVEESLNKQKLFSSEDVETPLEEYVSEFEQNRSWNLVGNPYPAFYDTRYMMTDAPFLVWNSWDNTYAAFSPVDDSYVLEPGEAFFIQRPVNDGELLKFDNRGRQVYRNPNDLTVTEVKARRARQQADRSVFNLLLTAGDKSDRTRVVFNEEAQLKYETSRDAAKFMASDAGVAQLWTMGGSVQYAINERPAGDGNVELAVRCGNQGTFTISLGENSADLAVVLCDRTLGTKTLLNGTEGYTFKAGAGTITGRFFLSIGGDPNNIEIAEAEAGDDDSPAFNVAGRQAAENERGIIIRKGQKVLRK